MIAINLFDHINGNRLKMQITQYVNDNIRDIIQVLIDLLEDDNDFTSYDFLPRNNYRIKDDTWNDLVYDLYELVSSKIIREYLKPLHQYLLYAILQWWEECADNSDDMILNKINSELEQNIVKNYTEKDGNNYVLYSITNYKEYYYILFDDFDFLPDNLDNMVTFYLKNPKVFNMFFPDVDIKEYYDLMSKDLQEQFNGLSINKSPLNDIFKESTLINNIILCCIKLQSNNTYKNVDEDQRNDYLRDLLDVMEYDVKDQTRHGSSASGKKAGEVDILIKKSKIPFCFIEALNLTYLNEKYLSMHIDKIYKYDTLGCDFNVIISYVKTNNLQDFWNKYVIYTEKYSYPYKMISYTPNAIRYTELRCAVSVLNRNGIKVRLYHIVIHITA